MKIAIESTTSIVQANGVPCRVWEGKTSTGIPVQCLIVRIAAKRESDLSQFEDELEACREPSAETAFPLSFIL